MSNPTKEKSPFVRFLEAFLQEENIKWILALGVCMLLGSSIRLVTMNWNGYTPVWQYLILTSYTAAVFLLGQLSYHRLGLRKTGTVLMALTVLLIPLSFLALHWIRPHAESETFDWLRPTGLTLAMIANLVWSTYAAHKIFQHFLRQTQPTFLVCYLILCVAGAIVPGLPIAWAPILSLALWAVFAAGTVKVNRHIFWLTEEHRLPRIFGFFPIGLLGAQFALVFLLGLASHITASWLGLLCTLIALPVLLTADTVARVFEQRTGGLVRPIPWSIIGPLCLGTLFSAAGVVLTLSAWPSSGMVVPTAVLAAISLAVIARRTQKSAFVWGMILCLIIAYQTSPVFFKQWVLYLRDQAQDAIHEPRLPYAFYGLTYAPFIILLSIAAKVLQRRGQTLFANPIRIVASVLPWILFAASFTHPKAILPVAVLLGPLFFGQAWLFKQRYLLIPAAMAFLAAAFGLPVYCKQVFQIGFSANAALVVWMAASALMLAPGFLVDRWSRSLPWTRNNESLETGFKSIFQFFSLLGTLLAVLVCVADWSLKQVHLGFNLHQLLPLTVASLLAAHALRWLRPGLGQATLAFGTLAALQLIQSHVHGLTTMEIVSLLLIGQWLLSYVFKSIPGSRFAAAFWRATIDVSTCGLIVISGLCLTNWVSVHFGSGSISWVMSLIVMAWGLDASRRTNSTILAAIAWISFFMFASAAVTSIAGVTVASTWWLLVWAAVSFGLLWLQQTIVAAKRSNTVPVIDAIPTSLEIWLSPLAWLAPLVFLIVAGVSLVVLGWPARCAALVALVGLTAARRWRLFPELTVLMFSLVNWQILATVATALINHDVLVMNLTRQDWAHCGLPLAVCAAISTWAFQSNRLRSFVSEIEVQKLHEMSLIVVWTALLFNAVGWNQYGHWSATNLALAAITWTSVVGAIFSGALRTQNIDRVWATLAAGLASLVYFRVIGAFDLSNAIVPYVCVFAGISLWSAGYFAVGSVRYSIVELPFCVTGFLLPLLVVPLAFWRIGFGPESAFAGANSLAMLSAAAFYFWRGMASRDVGTSLLSTVILNIALVLLWRELHWSDPQLFLMPIGISIIALTELLSREIPAKYHDNLRRVGSLVILISPTFDIVSGSWLHILTLMIAALCVSLLAIGLRVRTLLYTGTAFLAADMVALVARGAIDQPNVLWIVGVVLGGAVITLGAICENHRETVLSRLRGMSAALETWS